MTLSVLLFARVADLIGADAVTVAVAEGATARDVLEAVRALPGGQGIPAVTRVAVDQRFVSPDFPIPPASEVALIPPVAGG
jgi:molybdopterin converting factor subunit 1